MMFNSGGYFALVMVVSSLSYGVWSQDQCQLTFVTQPPAEMPCDPYHPAFNNLQLECNIIVPNDDVSVFVSWYYISTSNDTIQMRLRRRTDNRVSISNSIIVSTNYTTSIRSRLTLRGMNSNDTGRYWCQARINIFSSTIEVVPCLSTLIRPRSAYSNKTPCINTHFSYPDPVCVFPTNDCSLSSSKESDSVLTSLYPTPTSELTIRQEEKEDTLTLPLWSYPVIGISVLFIIIVIIMSISVCVGVYYQRKNPKRRQQESQRTIFTRVPTTTQLDVPMLTVQEPSLRLPCPLPKRKQSLPTHLSVTRQPSSQSEYKEMPFKREDNEILAEQLTRQQQVRPPIPAHLPLVPKRSHSLPGIAHHKTARPFYVNLNIDNICDKCPVTGSSECHLGSPPVNNKQQTTDKSNNNDSPPKVGKRSHSLLNSHRNRVQIDANIETIPDQEPNTNLSQHFYINHGPSPPRVYQSLTPVTLENQPLYHRPGSPTDHSYQPPVIQLMDQKNQYHLPIAVSLNSLNEI